jgi:hypothetical protein
MPFCKELNKDFDTTREMFAALKERREEIIGLKKASLKFTDPVTFRLKSTGAEKAEGEASTVKVGDTIYPVINTTNYLDSHGDVHIDGIWDVSVKDQKNKLYYIINHDLKIGSVIGYPRDVEAMVKNFTWAELGLSYAGTTQALIFAVKLTDKSNKDFLAAALDKEDLQNSVRMRYIAFTLCINDSGDDYKQEYANFYKYLAVIANKDEALEKGYFWAVTEAAVEKEGSAVLFGSNDATPILYSLDGTKEDPGSTSSQETSKNDPPEGSHERKSTVYTHFI